MTGEFSVIVPEAAINLVLNPSVEINTTGYLSISSTISRVQTHARFDTSALKIITNNAADNEGADYTGSYLTATAGKTYTFSVYVRGAGTVQLWIEWKAGDFSITDYITGEVITLDSSAWTRYTLTDTAPGGTVYAFLRVLTDLQQAATFYADGWQFEQSDHATTYIDGDQLGGAWAGIHHASASSRDAAYALGGVETALADYGIVVDAALAGIGVPPVVNNTVDYALLPGAQFQSTKMKSRTIDLVMTLAATSLATLLQKRADAIDLLGPASGGQPRRLIYNAGARKISCDARYVQGLQFQNVEGYIEKPVVRLLAVDPLWYADDQAQTALTLQQSVSNANYILQRKNGEWQALGSGANGIVYALLFGKDGMLYAGGAFSSMGGVSNTAYVAKWNGTAWSALATGADSEGLLALAVGPDGSIYAGGQFTGMSGVSNTAGIAKWNGSAWVSITDAGGVDDNAVLALAMGHDGTLYAAGTFTGMNSVADTAYIAKWNGTTWTPLGTGADAAISGLAIGIDGALYATGAFTTIGGVSAAKVAKWNGSAWSALGSGLDDAGYALAVGRDGTLYAAGAFLNAGGNAANRIAMWKGNAWSALGSGLNQVGYCLTIDEDGALIVGGFFTTVGGITVADRVALWNGNSWVHLDVDFPGTPVVSSCIARNGSIVVGFNSSGSATAAELTTVTPDGTADAWPVLTLIGPSSGTLTLQWIENQTTRQRMYFDLVVNAGEVISIDLRTGKKTVVSNWRGLIQDQPLRNSDFATWRLQPGANTIAAFATGTLTGASLMASWTPAYLSVDGAA